ncbi:JAB domain-containing protein [Pseudomonas aeruginosa]|uniref:JAB domain-containing protein n=1 Tax=Pseudomonas aeruginosa group TaxID=136841 RepID=UPI002AA2B3AF|nr:JAB domain-containing protein [Pseudomonas aeruginosa]
MSQLSFSSFDNALLVRDAQGRYLPASVDQILEAARQAIELKMQRGAEFTSPALVKEYLHNKLAGFEHEVFAVLFLDARHRLIEYREMFHGTIDSASVYPREVVKEALRLNAAAVILAHYVARHIMGLMCSVFLCGPTSETWRTAKVSRRSKGT